MGCFDCCPIFELERAIAIPFWLWVCPVNNRNSSCHILVHSRLVTNIVFENVYSLSSFPSEPCLDGMALADLKKQTNSMKPKSDKLKFAVFPDIQWKGLITFCAFCWLADTSCAWLFILWSQIWWNSRIKLATRWQCWRHGRMKAIIFELTPIHKTNFETTTPQIGRFWLKCFKHSSDSPFY